MTILLSTIENDKSVFLHYFDVHFLELKQAHLYEDAIAKEARVATRLALLWGEEILVPAASYFESQICKAIISELQPYFGRGFVWLVGGGANVEEFIYKKLQQYDP